MSEKVSDYDFDLPDSFIAKYPLKRGTSRLLVYNKGEIEHRQFSDLPGLLPTPARLVINDTKVIPARLFFEKETGAAIEFLLLEPAYDQPVELALSSTSNIAYRCAIGNFKKWKAGVLKPANLVAEKLGLEAELLDREQRIVQFSWSSGQMFGEVLAELGKIPLPPYLKREAEDQDKDDYQTVYSEVQGAVAAPTAGLHFTDELLEEVKAKNIGLSKVTLHVGEGTFKPMSSEDPDEHDMHTESFTVSMDTIDQLLEAKDVVAVGTTSLRVLESLYYLAQNIKEEDSLTVLQHDPKKEYAEPMTGKEALTYLKHYMERMEVTKVNAKTSIFIYPGFTFRFVTALITNFHLPKSTLVMLIAAFVGTDWKSVYKTAISSGYRFLSYGDSSLLIPKR